MTRDQAIVAVAEINHDLLEQYWPQQVEVATHFVDALIAIGVFIPIVEDKP